MGMFDDIYCEYPLPEYSEFQNRRFQTKSLDRLLSSFKITEEGKLIRLANPEIMEWDGSQQEDEERNFTGIICFYTFADDKDEYISGGQSGWIEYNAFFMKGQLVEIILDHYKAPEEDSTSSL